ncbi:fatty acyl-CoA reductase wat-like [Culicoides brevitarsis]|uniref:fatty acyl-CoA reductase wat-like n=1 Tax=Culicoides brevitarsis TaxID=469753 RepID=UPI00307BED1D
MDSPIVDFYKNKSILLTGFTGFVGQIITEKLLRCCDPKAIYVLVRNKKGKSWQDRLQETFQDPVRIYNNFFLFDRIRNEKPDFTKRVVGLVGDCGKVNLDFNPDDLKTILDNVNVVIHAAAIVKFDDTLANALRVNVQATKCLLDISRDMRNLQAFVYVSTAYSNCNQKDAIDEKFYTPRVSARNILQMMDFMDENLLNNITPAIIEGFPNTYTFSKHIAEDLVRSYEGQLPIVVFRPAIVMPSFKDPVSGWVNNYYGPVGLMYGIAMGCVHVFRGSCKCTAEMVPVDMVVSCILATAWDMARNSYKSIPVLNYVPSRQNLLTWGRFLKISFSAAENFPVSRAIWYVSFQPTESRFKYDVMHFFYHTIPGHFVDFFLKFSGTRFRLSKVFTMMKKLSFALEHFVFNDWNFDDKNVTELWKKMSPADQKKFFFDMKQLNWTNYTNESLRGMRLYIAKDDPSTIPYALRRQKMFKVVHYVVTYSIKGLVLYLFAIFLLWIYTSVIFPMFN